MDKTKEYGQYLREIRESKKLTLQKVYKDTKITVGVLTAIESMEKDVFPSETYHIGLLKLYAKYLSVNEAEIMEMVEKNKIQEKPIDFDLINIQEQRKKKNNKIIKIAIALVLLFVIVPIFFLNIKQTIVFFAEQKQKVESISNLEKIEGFYETNFSLNQKALLVSKKKQYVLEVVSITPPKISIDQEVYTLARNTPFSIDLNKNGNPDYILLMRSVNTIKKQLQLRFDPKVELGKNLIQTDKKVYDADGEIKDIITSFSVVPIQIFLNFKNPTYYKVSTDTEIIKESYAKRGDEEDFSSSESLNIYVSNSNFISVIVNDKEVSVPQNGLPYVFRLAWIEKNGQSILQLTPLP